mgnify:CR=1 FL=1
MNYFYKKFIRLQESKNFLKIKYFIQKYFKEKDIGNLNFNFENKPTRIKIIQDIIKIKRYNKYLEIGCFSNELFNQIDCGYKIGVDPMRFFASNISSIMYIDKFLNKFFVFILSLT